MEISYKVRGSAVIHEFLENEVIIADLDSGIYYSLRETAVTVWQLLMMGCHVQKIAEIISQHFEYDQQKLLTTLMTFVDALCAENLLQAVSSDDITLDNPLLFWSSHYQDPTMEKYAEMQELLMLDPIHEVDEQGWPAKAVV